MKINRIYAIVLRFLYLFRHNIDRWSDTFYWPVIDLLLWGLTGLYLKNSGSQNQLDVVAMILSGILLWLIVWRGQHEIAVNLLEDLWNKNLINIFASPLTFNEWICAFLLISFIKSLISLVFASGVAFLLYHFNLLSFGIYLLPFYLILIMFGWAVGFFVSGVILRYGTKIQALAWTAIMVLSPFSAIYYPLSILPSWAQKIALFVPTSYVFEGGRRLIAGQQISVIYFFWPLMLNIVYFLMAFLWIRRSFKIILNQKGLVKIF